MIERSFRLGIEAESAGMGPGSSGSDAAGACCGCLLTGGLLAVGAVVIVSYRAWIADPLFESANQTYDANPASEGLYTLSNVGNLLFFIVPVLLILVCLVLLVRLLMSLDKQGGATGLGWTQSL